MAENSLVSVTADRRDVGAVSAFIDDGPRVSTLYCRATLSATDDVEGSRRALAHALDRWIAQSALDADWRYVFTRDRATRRMLEFEPISLRAREMALGAHYAENPSFAIEQTTAIEGLSGDELNEAADRYLTLEQSRALLLEPGGRTSVAELSHDVKHAATGDGSAGAGVVSSAQERSEAELETRERLPRDCGSAFGRRARERTRAPLELETIGGEGASCGGSVVAAGSRRRPGARARVRAWLEPNSAALRCRLLRHSAETVAAEAVLAERIEHSLEGALREATGSTYYVGVDVERVRGELSVLRISAAVADSQLEEAIAPLLGWLESPTPFDEPPSERVGTPC